MQTWITDFNFQESAKNLDRKRLRANIYESIHILASLLDCTDKLVNPKKNVKNYPQARLWEGYENSLWRYIYSHINNWINRGYKYSNTVTQKNCIIILKNKNFIIKHENGLVPYWITKKLIQTHRSRLIQKNPEYYKKLWPKCPDNLQMRYDWRKI